MTKTEKREVVLNYVVGVLAFVLAALFFFYEYHLIGEHAATLPNKERAAFAIVAIIIFIFFYLIGGVILLIAGGWIVGLTWRLHKSTNREETADFIPNTQKLLRRKKRTLGALIAFKLLAAVAAAFVAVLECGMAHASWFSKITYCLIAALFLASSIASIVVRKKFSQETENNL